MPAGPPPTMQARVLALGMDDTARLPDRFDATTDRSPPHQGKSTTGVRGRYEPSHSRPRMKVRRRVLLLTVASVVAYRSHSSFRRCALARLVIRPSQRRDHADRVRGSNAVLGPDAVRSANLRSHAQAEALRRRDDLHV